MRERLLAKRAANALANLYSWGAVLALCESGSFSGASDAALLRVISVCKIQQERHLREYDKALAAIGGEP